MRIAVDAMGGDHAPGPIVEGVLRALHENHSVEVVLVGDTDRVGPLVAESQSAFGDRLTLQHATDVAAMDEAASLVMRRKDSSINVCWSLLAEGSVQGVLSAGSTGATVAGGLRTKRFLPNVARPGIAVTLPTPRGWSVLVDVGANVVPKPEHLLQYGVMGAIFAKQICECDTPTIGLLNVGSEEGKGNELAKQTESLFHNAPPAVRDSFRGNVEGRDLFSGLVDVIVCDGFVGNIVLKSCEGTFEFVMRAIGAELARAGSSGEVRDTLKSAMLAVNNRYHHSEFGGAPLLGIDGVCLIAHGGSDARAIHKAIDSASRYLRVNETISCALEGVVAKANV